MGMIRIRVDTKAGLIDREIPVPGERMRLADLARGVHALSDANTCLVTRAAERQGGPVTCSKGCGVCCRQLVTISPAEAFLIDEVIEELPAARREEVLARFARGEAGLEAAGLLEPLRKLDDPALSDEEHYRLAEAYFRLGQPCVFLEEGACSIYPERPALCREYLVRTLPGLCADPFVSQVGRLGVAAPVSEALELLCAQCLRSEVQPIPLALAPRWARENREAQARLWDSRGLVSRFLLYLEVAIGQAGAAEEDIF